MEKSEKKLIQEEQEILDSVISQMDEALKELNLFHEKSKNAAYDAKSKSLPDTYGALIIANNDEAWSSNQIRTLQRGKNELYTHRMIIDVDSPLDGFEELNMPIGLHNYMRKDKVFIYSWVTPMCRSFILNNTSTEYDGEVVDKFGNTYTNHFELKLKREVEILFDKVKHVQHFFPLLEGEDESLVYDAFLQELLSRRSEQEFRNIVFSIQKKQGEIIQTPFRENLIVQGCAGSGKSMIMLHRLPIILFDNTKTLSRSNLYIITPSSTYIEMSSNMRVELEIQDLKMGTINQYYDHVIGKYGHDPKQYGTIHPNKELEPDLLKFVYSRSMIEYIQEQISEILNQNSVDYDFAFDSLKLPKREIEGRNTIQRIRSEVMIIQDIIGANSANYRKYSDSIKRTVLEFDRLSSLLKRKKDLAIQDIQAKIYLEKEQIAKCRKELEDASPDRTQVYYQNRYKLIRASEDRIIYYKEELSGIRSNTEYFERIDALVHDIDSILEIYPHYKKTNEEALSEEIQYREIQNIHLLLEACRFLLIRLDELDDPYIEYSPSWYDSINELHEAIDLIGRINVPVLTPEISNTFRERRSYLQEESKRIADDLYSRIMERIGQSKNRWGRYDALMCSPYLYLQCIYLTEGLPNSLAENLIAIDEAQNLEPEELRLLKAVNKDQAVFNLYGDIKQHVEYSKGIDDWNELSSIIPFHVYEMEENYRNARQITEHCNKQFDMNMFAINLDGSGVHMMPSEKNQYDLLMDIMKKPLKTGMSCIIVKSPTEAEQIIKNIKGLENKVQDLTKAPSSLYPNRWNMMTIQQAKGLEFETVIVFDGRMTDNEKYIAYTRALDELYIFESAIPLKSKKAMIFNDSTSEIIKQKESQKTEKTKERKQRKKRTAVKATTIGKTDSPTTSSAASDPVSAFGSSDGNDSTNKSANNDDIKSKTSAAPSLSVKEFFESKNLEVIDARKTTGFLWVLGKQEDIDSIVKEAVSLYKISGSYSSGKTTKFKPGWFTKTKK